MAAHVAAMAPGTNIGAAVQGTGSFSTLTVGSDTISLSVIQSNAIKYSIVLG
jgi:membrane-bound ClpP family serine protease